MVIPSKPFFLRGMINVGYGYTVGFGGLGDGWFVSYLGGRCVE